MNILDKAVNKINMEHGEIIELNKRYDLYSYYDMEQIVLIDKVIDEEIFTVQYEDEKDKNNNSLVFTDIYGYDEIEETL